MPSLQHIQSRIRGVESTKQITNSMQLVSSSKVQHAKNYAEQVKPFVEHYEELLQSILSSNSKITHPYFTEKEKGNAGLIVISSDRGLCGGYNVNVAKKAVALANDLKDVTIIGIGSRIKDAFRREAMDVEISYLGISEQPIYEEAQLIAQRVTELYRDGTINQLHLVYTKFETMMEHYPVTQKLLPLEQVTSEERRSEYLWEPDLNQLLDQVIPHYLTAVILGAMVEASLSEQSARVISMDAASKNSDDIIAELTLKYNQLRQDAITQEIIEIVNGAGAVT